MCFCVVVLFFLTIDLPNKYFTKVILLLNRTIQEFKTVVLNLRNAATL